MVTPEKQYRWKGRKEAYGAALSYMKGRRKGEIKSFKTPWSCLNSAGVDGWEYGSVVLIGGRPGNFKTGLKDLIFNKAAEFNPGEKFNLLDIQMEMILRVTALREFASVAKTSYKTLCSAETPLDEQTLKECVNYANKRVLSGVADIHTIEDAMTILEFRDLVIEYMETHKDPITGEFVNTVVGIDHTRLFVKAPFEGSEEEMISNLGKILTFLKRRYPILFIVLSQLNRDIERAERNEDGKNSNYPTPSDIFGSDGIFQHCDLCLLLNRPSLKNIRYYGLNRFIIEDHSVLPVHIVKARNGDLYITFMRADGATMDIYEMEAPPMGNSMQKRIPAPLPQQEAKMKDLKPNDLFTNQTQ